MSTYYYKCKGCKEDVSELEVWHEFDGDYCIECNFKISQEENEAITQLYGVKR